MRAFLLACMLFGSANLILAQGATPLVPPPLSDTARIRQQIEQQYITAFINEFNDVTIDDFRFAYLVGEYSFMDGDIIAPEQLRQFIPYLDVITDQSTLDTASVDAVIVHPSALTWLSTEWSHAAYSNGVGFSVLDFNYADLQALTGDHCEFPESGSPAQRNPRKVKQLGEYTTLSTIWTAASLDPEFANVFPAVVQSAFVDCKDHAANDIPYAMFSTSTIYDLRSVVDLEEYTKILIEVAVAQRMELRRFEYSQMIVAEIRRTTGE